MEHEPEVSQELFMPPTFEQNLDIYIVPAHPDGKHGLIAHDARNFVSYNGSYEIIAKPYKEE